MGFEKVRHIDLPKICDPRGNLSFLENGGVVPFPIARTYWVYDVPGGTDRGGHSHRRCHQFIVAVSGSFDLEIDDGVSRRTVTLNRSNIGLYVAPGIWVGLRNFSSGSVCLTLASDLYDEADYVRDYDEFLNLTANKRK